MKKLFALIALSLCWFAVTFGQKPDWSTVEKIFGRLGEFKAEVFRITFPRTDLHVTVAGVEVKPPVAFTSWAAFKEEHGKSMVMGDLVLLEEEVNPVMSKLEQQGIQITAVHNHLLDETPRIMYMHYEGEGKASKLAQALKDALALTKTPLSAAKPSQTEATNQSVDWKQLEIILGHSGQAKGDILQVGVPRAERIMMSGMEITSRMGVGTAINFQAVKGQAIVTGDFVLLGNEVNPVIQELRQSGITVTAVHNHMLSEEPRLFFLHFWGYDEPMKLAQGLRKALDKTNSEKS